MQTVLEVSDLVKRYGDFTAVDHLTVVVRPDALVRGQAASTPGLLGNPWFIAGVVGIAVGTVMIVENQNDDDGSAGANRLASP